jgi:hypothetical protein
VLDAGQPCAWCDTILVRRRGGWKRPDRHRFSRAQLEKIAALHAEGASLRAIARSLYVRLGYSSEASCLETLRLSLAREGFRVRPPSSATALANRARRRRLPGETKSAYKRRMRREVGYRDSRTGEWKVATTERSNT